MSKKGVKRNERRRRAVKAKSAQEAQTWGVHSVDWARCQEPHYMCELACDMESRGFIECADWAEHSELINVLFRILSTMSFWSPRALKQNMVSLLAGIKRRENGWSFTDRSGIDELAYQWSEFYDNNGYYPDEADIENVSPHTITTNTLSTTPPRLTATLAQLCLADGSELLRPSAARAA